jgi:ATP-dependent helicase HrpB
VQSTLRDDLRIIIMSATLESDVLSRTLGGAPVLRAEGRSYPVEIRYATRDSELRIAQQVTRGVLNALEQHDGDVLAFLPGVGEIRQALEMLQDVDALVLPLYGELSLEEQARAIAPQTERKVILATSIAETSLTIEGVRVVVDSGYARAPRFDPKSGLTRLETIRVTQDAADQRAGRASRTSAGVAYRLWTQATHATLERTRKPEIIDSDLGPLALELAAWGSANLEWVTPPNSGALAQARQLLTQLEALDEAGRITEKGRSMQRFPAHPRLAHMLLEGQARGWGALAAEVAAILEERDVLVSEGADLALRITQLRSGKMARSRVEQVARDWRKRLNADSDRGPLDERALGILVALAYPDRIAQRRTGETRRYKLAGGRGVRLNDDDPLSSCEWLAVASLDAGKDEGRVYLAAMLHPDDLEVFSSFEDRLVWDDKDGVLIARREKRIGELILSSEPLRDVPMSARVEALCQAVHDDPNLLPWSDAARQVQARVQSLHLWRGDPFPDFSDVALLETLDVWLSPWLEHVRRRDDFAKLDLAQILLQALPWAVQQQLDQLAPVKLEVPTGSKIKLEYRVDGAPPILAVRLQEVFGWLETPTVNDGRNAVLMHLLSPAYRPVQVTQDLASFWRNTYAVVRKELRMRYPKHSWPEDPYTAEPVRGVKRKPTS